MIERGGDQASRPAKGLADLLNAAGQALIRKLTRRMGERGYPDARPAHGVVFANLDMASGSRITDIASRAGVTKQAIAEVVADLEAKGYVTKTDDPTDRRARIVRLTPRGRRMVQVAVSVIEGIEDELTERIGARRVQDLLSGLREVTSLTAGGSASRD